MCSTEIKEGMTSCPRCGSSYGIPQPETKEEVKEEQVVEPQAEVKEETPQVEVPPVVEQPAVVTPPPTDNSLSTVEIGNINEQPNIQPTNNNSDNNNQEPENGSSSIIIIVFIIIIAVGLGYVGYLFITGQNMFDNSAIVEDDNTTTTTTSTTTTSQSTTVSTTVEPTTPTTTVKANLNTENLITKIDNYTISSTIKLTMDGNTLTITTNGVVDQKNKKDSFRVTTSTSGRSATVKAYYDYNTGYLYMLDPTTNSWIKQRNTEKYIDLASYINKLNSNSVTKVGEGHYKVTMTKQELKGMTGQSGVDSASIKGDLDIDIYTENGYIVKMEADFSKVISGVSYYKITNKFSKYDTSGEVVIPQDVINTAKNS
jgi:flagellar basal body-associated protein FliL